ncbi:anti-sigma factor family protein [Geminicoccus roseus]|uniref:anti-sigma factor family protein n=1 Tax=Geminicoccus roseus TaxID=404900 RepID=UPI00040EAED4|nr:anti-sigma factor [Geminicoccus roseus]
MNEIRPDEADLHALVDGQLDGAARRRVEERLAVRPDQATQVAGWRRDAERLRAAWANPEMLPANPALDPARVRHRLQARRRRYLAMAAMLALTLCLGATGGWQMREATLVAAHPPMEDALQAYRLFADEAARSRPDGSVAEIQPWLAARFGDSGALPDLQALGLRPVDGRLLVTDNGAAAMVLYEDAGGQRVSFYIRPRPSRVDRIEGARRDGDLLAQYWTRGDYSYAVVTRSDDPRADDLPGMFARDT